MIGVNFIHAAYYSLTASHVCMDVNDGEDLLISWVFSLAIDAIFYLTTLQKSLKLRCLRVNRDLMLDSVGMHICGDLTRKLGF